MSKCDKKLRELRDELGDKYSIRIIDMARCLYRDFGNGFDVEICNMDTTSMRKRASIYLWFDKRVIVKAVRDVPRGSIGDRVEELLAYSEQLLRQGLDTAEKLYAYADQLGRAGL